MADNVTLWMGRSLDEMNRDELLELVKHLARQIDDERKRHMNTLDMWNAAVDARARSLRPA